MKHLLTGLSLLAVLACAAATAAEDTVLFKLDGQEHRAGDLPDGLALKLYQLEFEHHFKLRQLVDDAVFDAHVDRQAAASGRDRTEIVAELLAVEPATDAEIESLYRANQARIGAPLAQVRGRIAQFVAAQRRAARKSEVVAGLGNEGRLEFTVAEPIPPRVDIDLAGYPARGADQPTVTVVEFADYQCPFCRAAGGVLEKLLVAHPDRLQVVFVDFPINPSGISRLVARGAVCAGEQGRYWDYHDLAFDRQRQLDDSSPLSLATALELDATAFQSCLDSPRAETQVMRGETEARRLGLDSTPTLFVNGRRVIIQDIERELPRVIEAALAGSG